MAKTLYLVKQEAKPLKTRSVRTSVALKDLMDRIREIKESLDDALSEADSIAQVSSKLFADLEKTTEYLEKSLVNLSAAFALSMALVESRK